MSVVVDLAGDFGDSHLIAYEVFGEFVRVGVSLEGFDLGVRPQALAVGAGLAQLVSQVADLELGILDELLPHRARREECVLRLLDLRVVPLVTVRPLLGGSLHHGRSLDHGSRRRRLLRRRLLLLWLLLLLCRLLLLGGFAFGGGRRRRRRRRRGGVLLRHGDHPLRERGRRGIGIFRREVVVGGARRLVGSSLRLLLELFSRLLRLLDDGRGGRLPPEEERH
mmetsp:Transcript_23825/g.76580  ORF Transcript_23825/g.76580 Transcript_23825/m.76580 type:complete len:223 (-) Transcript_23825:83-751(-)